VPKQRIGKFRRSTTYTIEFPTLSGFKKAANKVDLLQKQGSHDILNIEYMNIDSSWFKSLTTGIPIKFTFQQGTRSKVWLGYVSHVTSEISVAKINRPMTLTCISSSFVLKERGHRVFKNVSIPEVASVIAKEHGFKFVGENHPRKFSQLVLSGHSYWEWLQEHANKIGYAMYVDGTTMVFRPINKLIDETSNDVPIMQNWDEPIRPNLHNLDRTLDYIHVLNGEFMQDTPNSHNLKQVGGVNPVTSAPFVENKRPSKSGKQVRSIASQDMFLEHQDHQVVNDQSSAKLAAEGSAILSRFNLPAKILGQGDPRIRPYHMVSIDGTGNETDGFWIIREVHHKFTRVNEYSVECVIASDGLGPNISSTTRQGTQATAGIVNLNQIVSTETFAKTNTGTVSAGLTATHPRYLGGYVGSVVGSTTRVNLASTVINNNGNFIEQTFTLKSKTPLIPLGSQGKQLDKQGFARNQVTWRTTLPNSTINSRVSGRCH
jgi:phage protein D